MPHDVWRHGALPTVLPVPGGASQMNVFLIAPTALTLALSQSAIPIGLNWRREWRSIFDYNFQKFTPCLDSFHLLLLLATFRFANRANDFNTISTLNSTANLLIDAFPCFDQSVNSDKSGIIANERQGLVTQGCVFLSFSLAHHKLINLQAHQQANQFMLFLERENL